MIGELDGKGKYTLQSGEAREPVDPFVAERQRESHLTMLGHKVLRFTFDELKNPGKLVEKMRLAGIPRRPDWLRSGDVGGMGAERFCLDL